jgi:CheY-like chemotaxis protein
MRSQVAARERTRRAHEPVVLVVEDEALLRNVTGEYLRLCGYVVIEASDSTEAIEVIGRGERPDIVFSDISLPGTVDGLSLARWLRQRRPDLHVMLTSGYGEAVRPAATELVGRDYFVAKPYHQQDLARRIDALLGIERVSPD